MNQLLEVRKNISYVKGDDPDEYIRVHEIVLIVDKPVYIKNHNDKGEAEIIRERGCDELRFTLSSDEQYDAFLKILTRYKDIDESELV